jgi:hypothetical protein
MNTLNFNDADLKANREGRLSDAQKKRLDAQVAQIRRVTGWTIALIIGIIVSGSLIMLSRLNTSSEIIRYLISPLTIYIGFGVILIGMLGLFYLFSISSIRNIKIHIVEGTAEVTSTFTTVLFNQIPQRLPINRLQLHRIRNRMFTFQFSDSESLRYFENGKHYRVYYLSQLTPFALSAEEIEPEKAKR